MLEGLSRAFGYGRAIVALYDPAGGVLRGTVGLNVPEALVEAIEIPLGEAESPMVIALREGVPVRVDDSRKLSEDVLGLLLEMEISSFVVVPLRSRSEQFGLATWQGRDVPAVGVVILSKDETISDADIERLMPFATQAGTALVRASDVERLQDSSDQHAVEKEWLYWMVNGFADPVVLTDADNDIILQNVRAQTLFKANADDSEGKRRAIWMNNFLFTAALSTSKLEQNAAGRSAHDLTLVDPIEGTELLLEMRMLPATNYFNGARGTVAVLTNITDLRHATEQVTQNVHRLQTAEEEIRLERDRLNLIMRSVPNPIILMDIAGAVGALAGVLGDFLRRMNRTLHDPPYNFMLHSAPLHEAALDHFHWHLEIIPKLTRVAGFEWGSGFFINPVPPEDAATALREAAS